MGFSDGYERYRTKIADIFSSQNKLKLQLKVEVQLAKIQEKLQMIPKGNAYQIEVASKNVTSKRVQEIEMEIHHDLMAMVKALAEQAGKAGEYVHYTATSMDIQDTVLAIQMVESRAEILTLAKTSLDLLYHLMIKYQNLECIARTHGQHAVPITVGFKFANFLFELGLVLHKFKDIQLDRTKFSGAVGNYASSMRLDMEAELLGSLGLKPIIISTQVVTRTIHSDLLFITAQIAAVIEKLANEIRNLQRSEIGEWFEPIDANQVGSSAMPHKRNPHKSERLCGLARILRANAIVGLENVALEHERDITNSAPERLVIPENLGLLYYMLKEMNFILQDLEVNEMNIQKNLDQASGAQSEQILRRIAQKIGRQKGHELLRKHMGSENFRKRIIADDKVTAIISKSEINALYDNINHGLTGDKIEKVKEFFSNLRL